MVTESVMTVEQFEVLPEDGRRLELVRGEVIDVSPASFRHAQVAATVSMRLGAHALETSIGAVVVEAYFVLSRDPDTVRAPDVAFVSAERLKSDDLPDHPWDGPPDLAVEILSPSDRYGDVARKVEEYVAAGTRLVWVVDTWVKSVTVYEPGTSAPRVLIADDTLTCDPVLTGLDLRVADLFTW